MKKYLFIFGILMASFLLFKVNVNAVTICTNGAPVWTPSASLQWKKVAVPQFFTMEQNYSEDWSPEGTLPFTFSGSCTASATNGARCETQCLDRTQYQDFAACPTLEQRLSTCNSPANKIDTVAPTCGNWSGAGAPFTLSDSTDTGNPGGDSDIQIAGGTCNASAGGTCTVDIYDKALNKTTCTSPMVPSYSCTGSTPSNSIGCSGDESGLTAPASKKLVSACTVADKCEFTCSSGYQYQNVFGIASCVPVSYSCLGPTPANSSICSGDDIGLTADATKFVKPACTSQTKCEYTCNSGYVYDDQNPTGLGLCKLVATQSLACSPRSQSIGIGAGVRYAVTGGDGNYIWSAPAGNCFGEVEPGNPSVFWPGCNVAGTYWVSVRDNSGHNDSCQMVVTPASSPLSCSPATQTVAELQGASFSATGGVGTLRWSTSGSPYGSPMSGTGSTFWTSYGKCGEKTITVTDDAGTTASCGLTVTGATCSGGSCNYNGVQDNGETGIDCGGGNCPACGPPPVCVRYWESNPHMECVDNSCALVEGCGSDSGGCYAWSLGDACGQTVTGSITVIVTDRGNASWNIMGPEVYGGSGGSIISDAAAPGIYTLTTEAGYSVDLSSRPLFSGGSITFTISPDSLPTCFISALPGSQGANIGANASFTATTTCSDGSTPSDDINLTDWSVNKSASFVSGENNNKTTILRCDSSTGGVPALVTPTLGTLTSISSSLTCNPILTCSPVNQEADINQNANFTAAGGTTYSWTASGGSPASGSGSSFSTRYNSLGNKIVTVSSGENNASCSVSVIQPTHSECTLINGAPSCSIVSGRGSDRCLTSCDCGDPACSTKYSCGSGGSCVPDSNGIYSDSTCNGGSCSATYYNCSNGLCAVDPGAVSGFTSSNCNNSCSGPTKYSCSSGSCQADINGSYTDSTCGGVCSPTYYSCSNGACSADPNGQFTSADCDNMCVAPIHAVCDPVAKACVNTVGPGSNTCSADTGSDGCGGVGQTHLGCIGNACVILGGAGSDDCGAVGEVCVTGGGSGGGKCSLKAAPPLVSGGQSVKLSWQCVGAPMCSLTRKYNNSATTITVQDSATRTTGSYSDKPTSSAIYTLACDEPTPDVAASVKVSTLVECAPTDPSCKP